MQSTAFTWNISLSWKPWQRLCLVPKLAKVVHFYQNLPNLPKLVKIGFLWHAWKFRSKSTSRPKLGLNIYVHSTYGREVPLLNVSIPHKVVIQHTNIHDALQAWINLLAITTTRMKRHDKKLTGLTIALKSRNTWQVALWQVPHTMHMTTAHENTWWVTSYMMPQN